MSEGNAKGETTPRRWGGTIMKWMALFMRTGLASLAFRESIFLGHFIERGRCFHGNLPPYPLIIRFWVSNNIPRGAAPKYLLCTSTFHRTVRQSTLDREARWIESCRSLTPSSTRANKITKTGNAFTLAGELMLMTRALLPTFPREER